MSAMRIGSWILACCWFAGAASAAPSFTDVTVAAGVDYTQNHPADPPLMFQDFPSAMSGAAAAGDVDADGCVDLYVTRLDDTDLLFRNRCDGTFEEVSASAGLTLDLESNGCAFGDVDNDGDLDLYVTTFRDDRYYLFINDGSGAFSEEGLARGAAIAGFEDHFGYSVTFGDYDRDGWLDLYVGEWRLNLHNPISAPSNARLLRNQGGGAPGTFEDVTEAAGLLLDAIPGTRQGTFPFAPRFSDMDGDGWPDLVIAADFTESRLFWNEGDGTFSDGTLSAGVGTDENGMGSAVADFDGDGLLDWFVTSVHDADPQCPAFTLTRWGCSGNRLFLNQGDRTFVDATDAYGVREGDWGWGAAAWDFDNDADPDLVMVNGVEFPFLDGTADGAAVAKFANDPMKLWRNDGAGVWPEVAASVGLTDTGSGKGIVTFDYDQDGDLDLFIVNNGGSPTLYRNDGGDDNDWLRVEARGPSGQREAIGSRVEVQVAPGGAWQMQEIDGGSHFLGQSERVAHFGLGAPDAAPVHRVRVRFPGGQVVEQTSVARNQQLLVVAKGPMCGALGIEPLALLWAARAARRRLRRR